MLSSDHGDCRVSMVKCYGGLSLIELMLSMTILGLIGVGISLLLQTSVNSQMISRSQQLQQNMAFQILPQLRADLLSANNLQVLSGGNKITFIHLISGGSATVSYRYLNGSLTRTENGVTRNFLPTTTGSTLFVNCNSPCFRTTRDRTGAITQITLQNLSIKDSRFPNKPGLTFPVQEASFSIVNGNRLY